MAEEQGEYGAVGDRGVADLEEVAAEFDEDTGSLDDDDLSNFYDENEYNDDGGSEVGGSEQQLTGTVHGHEQPSISVYAKLPVSADPTISNSWMWTFLLDFPTGVVLGAEGNLRTEEKQQSPTVNYEANDLYDTAANLYYHYNDPESATEHMLPIDSLLPNAKVLSTARTPRRHLF